MEGDVIGGSMAGADLLIYGVLLLGNMLVCSLGALVCQAAWRTWGPARREKASVTRSPSPEERTRIAVYRLEEAGVDLPAVLGDWSPTRLHAVTGPSVRIMGRTSSREPSGRSPAQVG